MQKIVNELITSSIKGVDVYRWKNATWLIFTNQTRWVVELTDEGTLWYNYKFFNDIFKYVSITVGTEMDGYIIQWANDFFYKDCAHRTIAYPRDKGRNETPNVLENGIKNVSSTRALGKDYIDKVVDEGIKKIGQHGKNHGDEFEWHTRAVIGNGVKGVEGLNSNAEFNVRNVMNYGVKEVYDSSSTHRQMRAQNLIPRIVKDVKPHRVVIPAQGMDRFYYDPGCSANTTDIWMVIEEGIKNIYPDQNSGEYDWSDEFEAGKVIEGGVKL